MEPITAYKTDQGVIFETEAGARRHEFMMLLKYTAGALPDRRPETLATALEIVGREISSGVYPDAYRRLLTAAKYLENHAQVIFPKEPGTTSTY